MERVVAFELHCFSVTAVQVEAGLQQRRNRPRVAPAMNRQGIIPGTKVKFQKPEPIALDDAVRSQRLAAGDLVLLGAFGGGLTWATGLVRW